MNIHDFCMSSGTRHHEDEELSLNWWQVIVVLGFTSGLLEGRLMHAGTADRVSRGLGTLICAVDGGHNTV